MTDNEPVEIEQFLFKYNGKSYTIHDMLKLSLEERQVIQDAMNIEIDEEFDLVEGYEVYDYMPKEIKEFCDLALSVYSVRDHHFLAMRNKDGSYSYSLDHEFTYDAVEYNGEYICFESQENVTAKIVKYLTSANPHIKMWITTYIDDSEFSKEEVEKFNAENSESE